MKLLHCSMIAGVAFAGACATASTDPNAGEYNAYYSERAPETDETSGDENADLVKRLKKENKRLRKAVAAKRPPVKGKKKRGKRKKKSQGDTVDPFTLEGFMPTVATPGSVIEVFGSGLDQEGLEVLIAGEPQKIIEAEEDRVLVEVVKGPSGKVVVATTAKKKGKRGKQKAKKTAKSDTSFVMLKRDGMLGRKRLEPANGLLGNVYKIDEGVTELPSFNDVGEPIAVLAVDKINIKPGNFKQGLGDTKSFFGVHFRGSLNVVEADDYSFCLNAGDGAQLYLDSELIVDNDGVHETKEVCEELAIEAGEYQLDLLWFQADGPELGLQLFWTKGSGEREIVPTQSLFPPADGPDMAIK